MHNIKNLRSEINSANHTIKRAGYKSCSSNLEAPQLLRAKHLKRTSRQHKRNLPLCEALAQAQAASHRTAYAYFTRAQCQLLQGKKHFAMQQLKQAKRMSTHDRYLTARIDAKIDEVKQMMSTE